MCVCWSGRWRENHCHIALNRIWAGGTDEESGLSENVMKLLRNEMDELIQKKIAERLYLVPCQYHTPWSVLEKEIDEIRNGSEKIDAIFVDYLNVIGRDKSFEGRYDLELDYLFNTIQNYGKKHKIAMFTAQQLKTDKVRELQKKATTIQDFRVGTGDISGTKGIAANADYIFSILIDPATTSTICLYNIKARVNPSMERFMLAYDRQSGRIREQPFDDQVMQNLIGGRLENLGDDKHFSKEVQSLSNDPLDFGIDEDQ